MRLFIECLQKRFSAETAALISVRDLEGDQYRMLARFRAGEPVSPGEGDLLAEERCRSVERDALVASLRHTDRIRTFTGVQGGEKAQNGLRLVLGGMGRILAVPLYLDGAVHYWLLLGLGKSGGEQPGEAEAERLLLTANLAFTCLARISDIRRLKVARDRLRGELSKIARLQQMLLPALDGPIAGLRKSACFSACEEAGGDYYDLVNLSRYADPPLAEGERDFWGVLIADAAGHGAAAAVEVAMFDAILRTYREGPAPGPAHVFAYANRHLFTRLIRGSYITAFVANFDPRRSRLSYANAGHPMPLLRRACGEVAPLPSTHNGIPLGVRRDYAWRQNEIALAPGDTLLLYTDGVTEARSPEGLNFGVQRLARVFADAPDEPEAILACLHQALEDHRGCARQRDDQTMLALQLSPHA